MRSAGRWLLPIALGLLFCLLLLPATAAAPQQYQATPRLKFSHDVDFPNNIFFFLTVDWKREVERVVLRYSIARKVPFEEFVDCFPPFTPGKHVKVKWRWDLRRIGGLPPGTKITYRWLIKDALGESWSSPPQRISFVDPRFDWREVSESGVTVFWYRGDRSFALKLLRAARHSMAKIEEEMGLPLEGNISFFIYENPFALQGARIFPQEWEGGAAFPAYGKIVLAVSPENLEWGERAVAHELSHFAVHFLVFPYTIGLPNWLNEGLAMYAEGRLSWGMADILKRAVAEDNLLSVKSLGSAFPPDPQLARLAYAQSYSLVAFLIDIGGPAKMRRLLEAFGGGAEVDEALTRVYGFDLKGLEARWRRSLGLPERPGAAHLTPRLREPA